MILITIGRNPSNKIVISHPSVSDYHAEIKIKDDGTIGITDKSSNGTIVKGRKVPKDVEVSLSRGEKVSFAGAVDLDWNQVPLVTPPPPGWHIYSIGSNLSNRIQINDAANLVSRFHATLKIDPKGKAYINDHSANGTFVDGIRIPSNQDYPVKRKSKILFANTQPLDWKQIKGKTTGPWLKIAVSLAAVLVLGWAGVSWFLGWPPFGNDGWEAYQSSTTMIYHAFYYEVTLDDETLGKYEIGMTDVGDSDVVIPQLVGIEGTKPFSSMGTGFFIADDGKIVTSRHIAAPWDYLTPETEEMIRTYVAFIVKKRNYIIKSIRGRTVTLRAGFYNKYYESLEKFEPCKVLQTSNEKDIDLAVIQINDKILPPSVKKIVDISKAETEDKKLKVGDRLTTIGYPAGAAMNYRPDEDGLKPIIKSGNLQRDISAYSFDINVEILSGSSGSPVFNDNKQLIGVINSGYTGSNTFGKGILAKHIKKLLDEAN
jgi:pSer/pThr/pTyr-binding forkhead associated (FHA) protein/V8-like Glu-specific endopeptidase